MCKYHRQMDRQTDRQTHQKYSSEPHKIRSDVNWNQRYMWSSILFYSSEPHYNQNSIIFLKNLEFCNPKSYTVTTN